ncbi:hypothetical protein HYS97_03475, partial [Candidatus Daviesbacteria bacterium]|nr:hypothetical protein [Candidatus Daviesbacteria bacterium]
MAVPLNPAEQVRTLLNIIVRNVGKRELWKSFKKPNTPDYILNRVFSTAITAGITTPQVVLNRIRRWNAKYSEGALQGSDSEFIRYIARSIKYRSDPRLLLALSQTSPSLESKEKDQEEKEQKKLKEQKETEQKKILGGGKPATPPVPVPSVSKPIPSPSAKWVLPEKIAKIPTELHKDSVLRKAFPKTSPITQAPTSGIPPKPIPTSSAKWTLPENYAKVAVTIPSRSILRQAFPRTTRTTAPPSQVSPSRPINQPSNQSQPSSPPLQRENLPSRNRRLTPPFVPFRSLAIKTAQRFLIPGIVIGIVLFTILYPFFKDLLQSSALLPLSVSENACFNQGGGNCPSSQEIEANSEDQNTCKFLNPGIDIHDSSKPAGLSAYIDKYKPLFVQNYSRNTGVSQTEAGGEFDKRLDYILTRSKQVGLNPMLFLALWKSENDFSSAGDSVYHMGCMAGSLDFYSQVDCATGIGDIDPSLGEKNSRGETIGSFSSRCASPKNPHRASACGVLESIRSSHPDIYPNDHSISPFNNPIQTFDEWEESFGPHSPILNRPKTSTNNNCIHAYNLHIQIAYRAEQTSARCPESFRCEPGLTFSSPKLISYIDKVAKDTGVPASLLGGIVRVEATVPQHDASDTSIWVQTPYSISDYTDADIDYI